MIEGWKYYNHAMIPTTAPNEKVNLEPLKSGEIWKQKTALFARWTENFDCGYETEWWYCIKDDKYTIENLKSKRRYIIKKGRKNFYVQVILPKDWKDKLTDIKWEAFKNYPKEYKPNKTKEQLGYEIENWNDTQKVFGAFDRETGDLCGYALVSEKSGYCELEQQKSYPQCEKKEINAAIIDAVLLYYNKCIQKGYIIIDGQRNVRHKTTFQDYLEKYFGFRKAYCVLNIQYRSWVKGCIRLLYPVRNIIKRIKWKGIYDMYCVLRMEEIKRKQEKNPV